MLLSLAVSLFPGVIATTPQNITRVLQELYESTGGSGWDYAGMEQCLNEDFGLPSYIGTSWNFTTNDTGEYVIDPCSKETHFMGIMYHRININYQWYCTSLWWIDRDDSRLEPIDPVEHSLSE